MEPSHSKDEFIEACKTNTVYFWPKVVDCAKEDFNLYTQKEITEFLENTELKFIDTKQLEKIHNVPPFMVDAYSFESGHKTGYMAFFKNQKGNYFIKSFKLHHISKIDKKDTASKVKKIMNQIGMKL